MPQTEPPRNDGGWVWFCDEHGWVHAKGATCSRNCDVHRFRLVLNDPKWMTPNVND